MKLYVVFGCKKCKEVLSRIDAIADIDVITIKPRKNLGNENIYYPVENDIINLLSDVPTLIDGNNIVVGSEILNYLESNPKTKNFLIKEETL